MGSTTFKKYDRNRYRKIYPVNRRPPSMSYRSDSELVIETSEIEFSDQEDKSGTLVGRYNSLPSIVFSSTSTQAIVDGNVNLWLSGLLLSPDGVVSFTISASAPFTGTVSIQAMVVD